jgi:selenide, water dikinase
VRRRSDDDLGASVGEQHAKRFMLGLEPPGVGLGPPAVRLPGRPRARRGWAYEYAAKAPGHALAAECALTGGNLHRVETTARLTSLDAGGGCAAKYAAARLEELLAGFAPASSENLLVGLSPADDAAVYRLDDERALVFTTDFFPPMVDDPALFGAVAAANALNDIFAMGARPLLALSIAAFPEELPVATVRAIFDAAAEKVAEAGAVLAGGHTIRDDEPKYGLAAIGLAHPDTIWRKSEARAGDALFLTKPLGTGLVLTAVRKRALGEEALAAAAASMSELNGRAADLLRPFEPHAVTDVTGFGLLGHAHEMAERSGVRIVIEAGSLPALPGALSAARRGLQTGGDLRNREYVAGSVSLDGVPDDLASLAFDPQTSGGLLVALPAERSAVLAANFEAEGLFLALIGRVEEGSGVEAVD